MGSAIGVTLQGHGGYGDGRSGSQQRFDRVVQGVAVGKAEAPAVVVDDDVDVVGVLERLRGTDERRLVKLPVWRGEFSK